MKKAVTVLFAGLLLAQSGILAAADEPQGPRNGHEKRMERMTRDLNLTPEQQQKISEILKAAGESIRADLQKMRETRAEADKKVQEVLTPEQAKKYDDLKLKRKPLKERKGRKHQQQCDQEK